MMPTEICEKKEIKVNEKSKILWVDDTFANELHELMAYQYQLEKKGEFDLVKIYNVDEALKVLETGNENFACIILDIMMPYGTRMTKADTEDCTRTGIILARKIRLMDKYKDVPIVLLTGVLLSPETQAKCKKEDLPCFIKADITPKDFLKEIQKIANPVGGKS